MSKSRSYHIAQVVRRFRTRSFQGEQPRVISLEVEPRSSLRLVDRLSHPVPRALHVYALQLRELPQQSPGLRAFPPFATAFFATLTRVRRKPSAPMRSVSEHRKGKSSDKRPCATQTSPAQSPVLSSRLALRLSGFALRVIPVLPYERSSVKRAYAHIGAWRTVDLPSNLVSGSVK